VTAPLRRHRGLPGALPEGEALLWSGSPDWRVLARTALHVRKLALYFGLLAIWTGISAEAGGALAFLKAAGFGALPVALAVLYAWGVSRVAVYSITNRRVVLHIGLALPVTLNLPFARIASADLRAAPDGSGDLSIVLAGRDRFAYVVLWPHARPWRFAPAQPTLRGLADVARPAQVLARALAASAEMTAPVLAGGTASPARPQHATLAA